MVHKNLLGEKFKESISSVLPITLIVAVLCAFFIPMNCGLMLSFILGSCMIIFGMGLFSIGSDIAMSRIGNHIGARMTRSKKVSVILLVSFLLGIAITVAEPDLQVLAANTPGIDTFALITTVSVGVGLFLMFSMLRIVCGIPLRWMLVALYAVVFVIAFFSDKDFLSVAFDSGGVTTGPMTVPFIIALGIGVASIRSDKHAKADSFGLVALCSIGPIIAVLILGYIYKTPTETASAIVVFNFNDTVDLGIGYLKAFPEYMLEVAMALLPIFVFFLLFQIISLKLNRRQLSKIFIGILYTYVGLVFFLTGVNVGFSSLGYELGEALVNKGFIWLLVPLAMLMGWFIINAEPAVHVLNKQVAELSAGAISEKTMGLTLSIAVSCAMGLAMLRVITGISILWIIVPGYAIALILCFFVSPTFTAIAFDAGGVASGPLTATFMLPFAMGACNANGGNVMTDAFGLVALVAMMPLITVQTMGFISALNQKKANKYVLPEKLSEDEVIELWEVA